MASAATRTFEGLQMTPVNLKRPEIRTKAPSITIGPCPQAASLVRKQPIEYRYQQRVFFKILAQQDGTYIEITISKQTNLSSYRQVLIELLGKSFVDALTLLGADRITAIEIDAATRNSVAGKLIKWATEHTPVN